MSRVPFFNSAGFRNLAAENAERIAKRAHEGRSVWIAVVYGSHAPQTQLTVGEISNRLPLVEIVDRNAEIPGVVIGANAPGKVGREHRRCVGRRDHYQTRFADRG